MNRILNQVLDWSWIGDKVADRISTDVENKKRILWLRRLWSVGPLYYHNKDRDQIDSYFLRLGFYFFGVCFHWNRHPDDIWRSSLWRGVSLYWVPNAGAKPGSRLWVNRKLWGWYAKSGLKGNYD